MSETALTISENKPEDTAALRQLYLTVRQATFTWMETTHYAPEDFDKATAGELILVARVKDTVAGFISMWLPDHFIHHLYVDTLYQRKKIGAALLDAAIQYMHYPVRLKCLVKNHNALRFYTSKGFAEREKGDSPEGAYVLLELEQPIK